MTGALSPYEVDVLPFVRPFTDALVATVEPTTVGRLLDHGAGTGEVIDRLRAAGTTAPAVAVEPDAGMVQRLRHNFAGQADVEVFEGRLQQYVEAHPGETFGLVTSQLVLTFVQDPVAEL